MEDDETCLGYKISVYQDSINKVIPEYLVNFDYFNRIMEDYGFVVCSRDESIQMGLPEGSGMFIELYNSMINEIKRFPIKQNEYGKAMTMTSEEKEISFLNRYFVYKKVRTVNAEKIANIFIAQLPDELQFERKETVKAQKATTEALKEVEPKVKKLRKKILLVESEELEQNKEIAPEDTKPNKITKTRKASKKIEFDIKE